MTWCRRAALLLLPLLVLVSIPERPASAVQTMAAVRFPPPDVPERNDILLDNRAPIPMRDGVSLYAAWSRTRLARPAGSRSSPDRSSGDLRHALDQAVHLLDSAVAGAPGTHDSVQHPSQPFHDGGGIEISTRYEQAAIREPLRHLVWTVAVNREITVGVLGRDGGGPYRRTPGIDPKPSRGSMSS